MKNALIVLPCLALISLAACSPPAPPASTTEPLEAPAIARNAGDQPAGPVLDAGAVFDGEFKGCRGKASGPASACVPDQLESLGASDAAVAVSRAISSEGTPGYVSDWQQIEGVGVATIAYPLRANANEGALLIDSEGRWIDVDADPLPAQARAREPVSTWLQAHPKANPIVPAQAEGTRGGEDGGVELVYASEMRDCRACKTHATLRIAYQFDKDRRYIGQRVLELR